MINKLQTLRETRSEEGFTLIELMIVVVIIGILAAIAIPIFANQQKGAIGASLKSDVKNTNTELATALMKNPTATDVSSLVAPVVSDGNTVTVSGSWDDYTVRATNPDGDPNCWEFKSTTGKSAECDYIPAEAGGGQDEFDADAIVYSGSVSGYDLLGEGSGLKVPDLSFAIDASGKVRMSSGADFKMMDTNYNDTGLANGTFTMHLQIGGFPAYAQDATLTFTVVDGQITTLGNVSADFVAYAAEGATANHGTPYINQGRYGFVGSGLNYPSV